MRVDETNNFVGFSVDVDDGFLNLTWNVVRGKNIWVGFDKKQAAELLPILQHFIETGELPK